MASEITASRNAWADVDRATSASLRSCRGRRIVEDLAVIDLHLVGAGVLCRPVKDEVPIAHAVVMMTSLDVLTDFFISDL